MSIDEIRAQVGPRVANNVARDLVRKRALQRIRRGTYLIRPFRTLSRASQHSTAFMVEALLMNEPHYAGGLWAVTHHGFSEQQYTSILDVFVTHRLSARTLGAGRVRFHLLPKSSFNYGIENVVIEGLKVQVSDKERTLLDAFDRSRLFGGLKRALELADAQLQRIDVGKLVSHALAGSKITTCQRIGVLLERQGQTLRALGKLRKRAHEAQSLLSLNPERPRDGPINQNWNVVENDR